MYVCCGQVCWSFDDQGAGPYKGKPAHDQEIGVADDEEGWLRDVITERLQAVDAVERILQAWQTRAQRQDPESVYRMEYSQAIIPEMKQHYKSYLEEGGDSGEGYKERALGLELLRLRIIERRLCSIEFCDGCSEADRRVFIQEVDRVFANLEPSMEQNQQNNVLLSADEKAPALRPCFEAISGELSAINTTIRRMVVLDIDDRWDDVPEDTKLKQTCKQPADSEDSDHEEIDFEDSGCAWLLETAIFTGYSGYNGPSASSSTHNAQETKPLAEPRPNKRSTGASRQRPCRKLYHEAKQDTSQKMGKAQAKAAAKGKKTESTADLRSNLADRSALPCVESRKRKEITLDQVIVLSSDSEEEKNQAGRQAEGKRQSFHLAD